MRGRRPQLAVMPDRTDPAPGSLAEEALAHVDALYSVAHHLCGNASDAEDLVHTAYVRALAGAARFEPGTNLRAWLFRILHNCFVDQARRRKVVLELPDEDIDAMPRTDERELDQLRYVTSGEVAHAIAELPVALRLIILLDVEGFSEAEIAEIAHCAQGTVKSRLSRARAKLRTLLGGSHG